MKQHAAATGRNRGPILEMLQQWLPPEGVVLEIASGTGEHACWLAPRLPGRRWQPSDCSTQALASIAAWRQEEDVSAQVAPPLLLDVRTTPWPVTQADALFCANMIHISPWASAEALRAGAGRLLPGGGVLILYGPFKQEGHHTAPSNRDFDADLRARNPDWGVRDLEAVDRLAQAAGLDRAATIAMPANNLGVVWRRRP